MPRHYRMTLGTPSFFMLPWRLQDMRLTDTGDHAAGCYGFQGSKLFNGQITTSVVTGFATSVLLHACDNNLLINNRFWGFSEFAVYEASAQSFGSHNWLCFNDIAAATGAQAIYDKSFAQHPRRFGNYYELAPCKGGIHFSLIGARIFGKNVPETALTTIILRDNRIDSQGNGGFVYRVDPTRATTLRIEGVQTSDMSSTPSVFVDAAGGAIDFYPMHLSSGRTRRVYIEETTFGPHWDGHRSKQGVTPNGRGFRITAENAASIVFGSDLTGADGVAHFRGQQIVIPAGHADRSIGIFPDGYMSGNHYFAEGAYYRVTLLARSSLATGDTISIQQAMLDGDGSPMGTAFSTRGLTDQFRALDFYFVGRPASYKTIGFNVQSATSSGNIEFTMSWEEVFGAEAMARVRVGT